MKKSLLIGCVLLTLLSSGCCCQGGLRGLLRGGACNACQPGMPAMGGDENMLSTCEDGTCGHDHSGGGLSPIGTGADNYYGSGSLSAPGNTYSTPGAGGSLGSAIAPPPGAPLPGPSGSGN
jgi:hypothetical protein